MAIIFGFRWKWVVSLFQAKTLLFKHIYIYHWTLPSDFLLAKATAASQVTGTFYLWKVETFNFPTPLQLEYMRQKEKVSLGF